MPALHTRQDRIVAAVTGLHPVLVRRVAGVGDHRPNPTIDTGLVQTVAGRVKHRMERRKVGGLGDHFSGDHQLIAGHHRLRVVTLDVPAGHPQDSAVRVSEIGPQPGQRPLRRLGRRLDTHPTSTNPMSLPVGPPLVLDPLSLHGLLIQPGLRLLQLRQPTPTIRQLRRHLRLHHLAIEGVLCGYVVRGGRPGRANQRARASAISVGRSSGRKCVPAPRSATWRSGTVRRHQATASAPSTAPGCA